MLTKFKEMKQ